MKTLKKSRGIAAFLTLSSSKTEQVSQNSFVFKLADRQIDRSIDLTTSTTKQFCEISSIFQVDKIKNEAILRDFLQKWKVDCKADGLVPLRFAIFPLHLSEVLRLPQKSDAKSYEVLHLSGKIISDAPKRNALRKSAPGPPNMFLALLPANAFETATKPSLFAYF